MDTPFPTYQGHGPYIFVCYAHEDSATVYREIEWLYGQGINLWYDEGVSAGKETAEAMEGAVKILYYISSAALVSDQCHREIRQALDRGFEIVPVYLEEVELTGDLQIGLNLFQALHRYLPTRYRQYLLEAVGQAVEATADPTPGFQWLRGVQVGLPMVILIALGWWYWDEPTDSGGVEDLQARSVQPSIAVLPFANMSADSDNLYFSDGISEEILTGITKLSGINVIARTSSFSFREDRDIREIGELLKVTHVLVGSLRSADGRMSITAHLIDTADGSQLWSESYSRDLRDVFAVQDEIARAVLGHLGVELVLVGEQVAPKVTVDPAAYDAYLAGNHHYSSFRWDRAIESYRRAVEIAPDFAVAHSALARVHTDFLLGGWPQTAERVDVIERSVNRALELDPHQTLALAIQATTVFFGDREYQAGLDAFHGLLARYPNNDTVLWLASRALITIGRNYLALRLTRRSVELDPLSWMALGEHGQQLYRIGRFAEADAFFLRGRKIDGRLYGGAAFAALFQGNLEEAKRYSETHLADWDWEHQQGAWMGLSYAMRFAYFAEETEQATRLAQSLLDLAETKRVPDNAKSNAYYVLGNEAWVAALEQALANPSYRLLQDIREPSAISSQELFQNIRARFYEPEYGRLLRSVGLDNQSVAKLHVQDLPF